MKFWENSENDMSLKRNREGAWKCLLLLLPLAFLLVGCSGISASKSISPLDFLLPGLTGTDTNQAPSVAQAERPVQTAANGAP